LKVAHQTSYRATIASSELQHFFAPDGPLDVILVEAWLNGFHPIGNQPSAALIRSADELIPPPQIFCASLWFMPPPAA
jgi:hypothetical protein